MTNESTRPASEPTVLDAETFRAWQSELNEFIELTRQRLQTISQSCSQCRREQETFSQEVRELPTHCETVESTHCETLSRRFARPLRRRSSMAIGRPQLSRKRSRQLNSQPNQSPSHQPTTSLMRIPWSV